MAKFTAMSILGGGGIIPSAIKMFGDQKQKQKQASIDQANQQRIDMEVAAKKQAESDALAKQQADADATKKKQNAESDALKEAESRRIAMNNFLIEEGQTTQRRRFLTGAK